MPLSERQRLVLNRRLTDLLREVGTLLLAFAPLDYMLQPELEPWSLAGFTLVGGCVFVLSMSRELRRP